MTAQESRIVADWYINYTNALRRDCPDCKLDYEDALDAMLALGKREASKYRNKSRYKGGDGRGK